MTYHVRPHPDTGALLARAQSWLLEREAEHNLILALAHRLRDRADWPEGRPYFATVERADDVVGCVFRTPPYKLLLTDLPEDSLGVVFDAVGGVYSELPAVIATEAIARGFGELWANAHGVALRAGMRQRIYQLDEVIAPARPAPGAPRTAAADDVSLVAGWHAAFSEEAGVLMRDSLEWAEERVSSGSVLLWEDKIPTSMAVRVGETLHGARVGGVYTPPELRGRGYASSCVAVLSQRVLDSGRLFCFLYTDLANPTSNAIYLRIGYRPVCDVVDYDFEVAERA